jgi:hypothetical protein
VVQKHSSDSQPSAVGGAFKGGRPVGASLLTGSIMEEPYTFYIAAIADHDHHTLVIGRGKRDIPTDPPGGVDCVIKLTEVPFS